MCGCLCYDIKGVYLKTWPSDIDILLFHVKFDRFAHRFEFRAKNTAKRNMSSTVCALSMYSRLCLKILSFLFVLVWTIHVYHIYHVEFHFRFNISWGLAVMGRSHKKISGKFLRGGERGKKMEGRANF